MGTRITAREVCEQEAGSRLHRAMLITGLQGAAEAVAEEFEYDDGDMKELSELAGDLWKVCDVVTFPAEEGI